jgi:hypothetical protein
VAAIVNDGNRHRPLVLQGLGLGGSGDQFDIGQLQKCFVFHELFLK